MISLMRCISNTGTINLFDKAKTDLERSVSAFIQFRGLNMYYSGAEGGS